MVIESNPSYSNVFGSIEKQAWFGALITDHTMLKAGTLHRANGGYLIVKALDLLRANISYEALQRALRDGEIKIEEAGDLFGFFGTRSLKPEPIPLNLKIILTGDPQIYQLLYANDDRFQRHFKVKAHMDSQVDAESGGHSRVRTGARPPLRRERASPSRPLGGGKGIGICDGVHRGPGKTHP